VHSSALNAFPDFEHTLINAHYDTNLTLAALALFLIFGLFWCWNRRAKKWLEENDRMEREPNPLNWLLGERPENRGASPLRYGEKEFQEIVSRAMDELPEEFDEECKNVVVIVSTEWPTEVDKRRMGLTEGHIILGTYSGLNRTKGIRSDNTRHVIVVYQPALELLCGSDRERLEREVRRTILHELAHHLGMPHEKMKEIGL
jgi:predicted Zn-dependent protease with MMP-like domain